ncbi:MAG: sporulation protein YunB [Oscillospiraceae bacterium]
MRRKKPVLKKPSYIMICVVLIVALIITLFMAVDKRLRPVITTMAQYQCRVISMLAINEAVIEVLQNSGEIYDAIMITDKADDGTVSAVRINSSEINSFKARLTDAVSNKLLSVEKQDISIPLGTLLGFQIFTGRGPDIHLKIVPASFVSSEIINRLESAGINQTQHSVFIKFSVQMSAIMPGYSTSVTVQSEMCVAQTLIVGKVPQFFAGKNEKFTQN